jgi:hypothetical protein
MSDEAVCYAQSSRGAALTWTTLAFFAGFAGVSAMKLSAMLNQAGVRPLLGLPWHFLPALPGSPLLALSLPT